MVVSDKYRYVFIEVPHTASTAMRWELVEHYDGRSILRRHAPYGEFLKIASPKQKKYFVFGSVRNPLDEAVSLYLKMRVNHQNTFSQERVKQVRREEPLGFVKDRRIKMAQQEEIDFATYFKKVHTIPYTSYLNLSEQYFDHMIKFEDLQARFAAALQKLEIDPVRSLPRANKTQKPNENYLEYYTPEIIPRAKRVFGPFMKKWGYEFPAAWGAHQTTWLQGAEYTLINFCKNLYWKATWHNIIRQHQKSA